MEVGTLGGVIIALLIALIGMVGYLIRQVFVTMRVSHEDMTSHREAVEGALAGMRSEMTSHREAVEGALAGMRTDMTSHREAVERSLAGMRSEMAEMRSELRGEIGKVDGKVEYLTRRGDALQSDVSYIRGRLSIPDEQLPEGSKAPRTSGPTAQPPVSGDIPTTIAARL